MSDDVNVTSATASKGFTVYANFVGSPLCIVISLFVKVISLGDLFNTWIKHVAVLLLIVVKVIFVSPSILGVTIPFFNSATFGFEFTIFNV